MRFEELTSEPRLLKAVEELGWTVATPVQQRAIPIARAGRDMIGIAQTGTGKTGAFLIPALERQIDREGLHTLVLCPTRELAQQVAADGRELAKYAELFVGEIVGGMPMKPQIRDLRAGYDVIVATPGRLLDHIERGNVDLSAVEVLVLDEADRMLDMGFRPQIDAIIAALPKKRQTLLFSATMPNGVHALALRILHEPEWVEVTRQATPADNVEQVVYSVRTDRKAALLLHLLEEQQMEQVLVFTATKSGADLLFWRLDSVGISVALLHGDRDMKQRQGALADFAEGRVRVLVATDVAQRGLDVEGISHVINYDVPRDPEDYVHRIGRTGRAGASGKAVTFLSSGSDLAQLQAIERVIDAALPRISLPDFDYAGAAVDTSDRKAAKAAKGKGRGARMGRRSLEELTPEERRALLKVG